MGERARSISRRTRADHPAIPWAAIIGMRDRIYHDYGRVDPAVLGDTLRRDLFIQCDSDKTVAPHHGAEMKAASANAATELWSVPGCGHVRAFVTHPAGWEARVTAFLERELGR